MKAALLFSLLCGAASGVQAVCATTPAASVLDIEMCWAEYYARAYGVPLEFVQAVIASNRPGVLTCFPRRVRQGSCSSRCRPLSPSA